MKIHKTVTLDEELVSKAKNKNLNVSQICNDALDREVGIGEASKESEKALIEELEISKKFNLNENEFFLIKKNFDRDIVKFWFYNKQNFINVKSIYDLIEIRKAFKPLWAKETQEIQEVEVDV